MSTVAFRRYMTCKKSLRLIFYRKVTKDAKKEAHFATFAPSLGSLRLLFAACYAVFSVVKNRFRDFLPINPFYSEFTGKRDSMDFTQFGQ